MNVPERRRTPESSDGAFTGHPEPQMPVVPGGVIVNAYAACGHTL